MQRPTTEEENHVRRLVLGSLPVLQVQDPTNGQVQFKLAHNIPTTALAPVQHQLLMKDLQGFMAHERRVQYLSISQSGPTTISDTGSTGGQMAAGTSVDASLGQEEMTRLNHEIRLNVMNNLHADQASVLKPDLGPFRNMDDAIDRLLPYHIYQYPEQDTLIDEDTFEEDCTLFIRPFGLGCFMSGVVRKNHKHFAERLGGIKERFKRIRVKCGEVSTTMNASFLNLSLA